MNYDIFAQGSPHSGPLLAPAEVLIAIHGIDPDRDGIPLKKACLSKLQPLCSSHLSVTEFNDVWAC